MFIGNLLQFEFKEPLEEPEENKNKEDVLIIEEGSILNTKPLLNIDIFPQKDPSKDINMHTAKIASRMQMLSKTKKNFRVQKEIDMNYDSYLSSDESADENYGDLIKTKAEFYEAVDEILKEIELDFKNISLIMKNFNGLPKELFSF